MVSSHIEVSTKMKVLFLFAGVVALALTASVNVHKPFSHQYQSEKYDYAYMQKAILQLFKNVYQPNYYPELAQVGSTYSFETNSQFYTNPKYVSEFLEYYNFGYLPKGQVFSIFYDQHQKEAIAFFRVLYSAVDFDTFYKTAAWGRMHLNEGLYIYALSVALVHRPDTWQLELPPIYEMYPFYFYNAEALQKAHQYFFKGDYTSYFKPAGQQMPYFYGKSPYPEQYYQKYGSFPYQKGSESYQKSYPFTYGQFPYQKSQYPGQYEQYQYQQGGSYQKSYPWNYYSYPYTYGQFPYHKSQYPGQYEQYQYQQSEYYPKSHSMNYKSYPYKYGQYPYEKSEYPGQYEQYPFQHGESYSKSYPWNYHSFPYTYGQNPYFHNTSYSHYFPTNYQSYPYGQYSYQHYQYPTEHEQYPYYSSEYKSYPYKYGQYPYEKTEYPGQYEQYPFQHGESYSKSYPWNYHSFPYTYGQNPYFHNVSYSNSFPGNYQSYPHTYGQYPYEHYQYPTEHEQYYSSEYPSQYKSYPYFKSQYPYGKFEKTFPYGKFEKTFPYGMFEKTFPYGKTEYPYGKTPFFYEKGQYPYGKTHYPHGKTPFFYEKSQYPYGKTHYPYGKTPFFYEKSQYPYGKSQYPYGKTPYFYEQGQYPYGKTPFSYEKHVQFPTGSFSKSYSYPSSQTYLPKWLDQMMYKWKQQSNSEEYYPQERENVPEYFNQDNFDGVTIDYEYNTENPLFYFTEDIGMNAFYYYYHIYFPFWMTNEEIIYKTEFRGEQYYYFYQQLLARYNLERLSNGLSEIPLLDWDGFISYGFETDLSYPNGYSFPQRPEYAPITPKWDVSMPFYDNATFSLTNIKNYEYRVLEAIDSGFVWTRDGKYVSIFEPQGFEVLGNLIQANPESPNARYYGSIQVFARYVLGYSKYPVDQYNIVPSVLEHFETSLRDPAFYQLYKRVIYYFQKYKQYLPKYTPDELYMPGVKIEDVTFDKLVTYFDYFYSDISSALLGPIEDSQFKDTPVRVKQYRLNHQPFSYYLNVNSEKPYEAVIRVFLGPKYDKYGKPYTINHNRLNFVEFDRFTYSLVPGMNTIERNSRQSFFAPDRTSYKELYMQVFNVHSTPMYETTPTQVSWAMPQRMLLPKGSKEGQTFQMYFIITPYMGVPQGMSTKYSQYTPTLFWDNKWDKLPYGYPFDRPIEEAYFFVPNSYFKDVVIFNEGFGKY